MRKAYENCEICKEPIGIKGKCSLYNEDSLVISSEFNNHTKYNCNTDKIICDDCMSIFEKVQTLLEEK